MTITYPAVKNIFDTLPIGYYLGRNIDVELSDKATESAFFPFQDKIEISFLSIAKALKTVEIDDTELEMLIRGLLYHEISHVILTPKELAAWYDDDISDIINIFEDERIETLLRNMYMNVDFKRTLLLMNNNANPDITVRNAFYDLVRFRNGDKFWLQRVNSIINCYSSINAISFTREVKEYAQAILDLYRDFKEYLERFAKDAGGEGEEGDCSEESGSSSKSSSKSDSSDKESDESSSGSSSSSSGGSSDSTSDGSSGSTSGSSSGDSDSSLDGSPNSSSSSSSGDPSSSSSSSSNSSSSSSSSNSSKGSSGGGDSSSDGLSNSNDKSSSNSSGNDSDSYNENSANSSGSGENADRKLGSDSSEDKNSASNDSASENSKSESSKSRNTKDTDNDSTENTGESETTKGDETDTSDSSRTKSDDTSKDEDVSNTGYHSDRIDNTGNKKDMSDKSSKSGSGSDSDENSKSGSDRKSSNTSESGENGASNKSSEYSESGESGSSSTDDKSSDKNSGDSHDKSKVDKATSAHGSGMDGSEASELSAEDFEKALDNLRELISGAPTISKSMFSSAVKALCNIYYDQNLDLRLTSIVNNRLKQNKQNGSAINSYSGRLNPKSVGTRDDYRWWSQQNRDGHIRQYTKVHFNLFIDNSGSFRPNDHRMNCFIQTLDRIEKQNTDFTFDVITINEVIVEWPSHRYQFYSNDGNMLLPDIAAVIRKHQKPACNNYNIVLFDGDAHTDDQYGRMTVSGSKEPFKCFDSSNTYIISDGSNKRYMDRANMSSATIRYCDDYCSQFINTICDLLDRAI